MRPNLDCVIAGRRCSRGVVGVLLPSLPGWRTVRNLRRGRRPLESGAVAGDSPVDDSVRLCSAFPK